MTAASKQKYWGMGLTILGFLMELFSGAFPLPALMLIAGVGICTSGIAFYAKAKGSSYAWGLFGLVPVLGLPLFLFLFPLVTDFRKNLAGFIFSLVIIGVLAAIAVPNFMTYGLKARQAEAKIGLNAIHTAAMAWNAAHNTYAVSDIRQLGYMPNENARYSFWFAVNGVPTIFPGSKLTNTPCDLTKFPVSATPVASATKFVAVAKGSIIHDGRCDEWSINEEKNLVNTLSVVPGSVEVWMRLLGITSRG
jgi:type IV pilus assembly protein PilA